MTGFFAPPLPSKYTSRIFLYVFGLALLILVAWNLGDNPYSPLFPVFSIGGLLLITLPAIVFTLATQLRSLGKIAIFSAVVCAFPPLYFFSIFESDSGIGGAYALLVINVYTVCTTMFCIIAGLISRRYLSTSSTLSMCAIALPCMVLLYISFLYWSTALQPSKEMTNCNLIFGEYGKAECLNRLALILNDPVLCSQMRSLGTGPERECFERTTSAPSANLDLRRCEDDKWCISGMAYALKDPSRCGVLEEEWMRTECIESSASIGSDGSH